MLSAQDVQDILNLVRDNADKLGLIWELRAGTLVGSDGASASIQLDGDTTIIDSATLILPHAVDVGARIWSVRVPDSHEYVIGSAQAPIGVTYRQSAASFTISTTPAAAITSDLLTTTAPVASFRAQAIADLRCSVVDAAITVTNILYVDNVAQNGQIVYAAGATGRGTFAQVWRGTLAPGAHTFELRSQKSGATGTFTQFQTHSALDIEIS
jgi:hypothetical protein